MKLSDNVKKNLLDLQYNQYLQYYNTSIIILFTYFIGVGVAFITKQINLSEPRQFLSLIVISVSIAVLIMHKNVAKHFCRGFKPRLLGRHFWHPKNSGFRKCPVKPRHLWLGRTLSRIFMILSMLRFKSHQQNILEEIKNLKIEY